MLGASNYLPIFVKLNASARGNVFLNNLVNYSLLWVFLIHYVYRASVFSYRAQVCIKRRIYYCFVIAFCLCWRNVQSRLFLCCLLPIYFCFLHLFQFKRQLLQHSSREREGQRLCRQIQVSLLYSKLIKRGLRASPRPCLCGDLGYHSRWACISVYYCVIFSCLLSAAEKWDTYGGSGLLIQLSLPSGSTQLFQGSPNFTLRWRKEKEKKKDQMKWKATLSGATCHTGSHSPALPLSLCSYSKDGWPLADHSPALYMEISSFYHLKRSQQVSTENLYCG